MPIFQGVNLPELRVGILGQRLSLVIEIMLLDPILIRLESLMQRFPVIRHRAVRRIDHRVQQVALANSHVADVCFQRRSRKHVMLPPIVFIGVVYEDDLTHVDRVVADSDRVPLLVSGDKAQEAETILDSLKPGRVTCWGFVIWHRNKVNLVSSPGKLLDDLQGDFIPQCCAVRSVAINLLPQLAEAVVASLCFTLVGPEAELVLDSCSLAVEFPAQLSSVLTLFVWLREPSRPRYHFRFPIRPNDSGVIVRFPRIRMKPDLEKARIGLFIGLQVGLFGQNGGVGQAFWDRIFL